MHRLLVVLALSLAPRAGQAADVTSAEARQESVLDYLAGRSDLDARTRTRWQEAVRRRFGGSALTPGTNEGVTAAKSVLSAAIFFGVSPETAARSAYEAYHDTARWVPPPVAINYQVLAFQGRKPKVSARELAFDFPRYFNEEIAVDLVLWWDDALARGQINPHERDAVRRLLGETRALMRPMLLERLYALAQLESDGSGRDAREERGRLEAEIQRDYRAVAQSTAVYDRRRAAYDRYASLAKELGVRPLAPPAARAAPRRVSPPPTPTPSPDRRPRASEDLIAERGEASQPTPTSTDLVPAPLPGEPLVEPDRGWRERLEAAAKTWLGVPYRLGGTTRRGVDCSAFVRASYRQGVGVELPRNSQAQARTGQGVGQDRLAPGDLVFFDTLERGRITHVGLYLGGGQFVHASSSRGVVRDTLDKAYYQRAYRLARRLLRP